jgi:hypothetical protein
VVEHVGSGGEVVKGMLDTLHILEVLLDPDVKAPVLATPSRTAPCAGLGGSVRGLLIAHRVDWPEWAAVVDFVFSVTVPRPLFLDARPLGQLAAFKADRLRVWGVPTEACEEFERTFLKVVGKRHAEALRQEADAAYGQVKAVISQCCRGEWGGLRQDLVDGLLKPLPQKSTVADLLRDFLQARFVRGITSQAPSPCGTVP